MENKLAEAIGIVRGALLEIERSKKAAEQALEEQRKTQQELYELVLQRKAQLSELDVQLATKRKSIQAEVSKLDSLLIEAQAHHKKIMDDMQVVRNKELTRVKTTVKEAEEAGKVKLADQQKELSLLVSKLFQAKADLELFRKHAQSI